MTDQEIADRLIGCRDWYHIIDIFGYKTPGRSELTPQWDMMRQTRQTVDYTGKSVLDIASYDGLWAFEAEMKGAARVVAVDCCPIQNYTNMLRVRELLKSNVVPFYCVNGYNVQESLLTYTHEHGLFDIVQHMGLLYHQRDPLLSLSQARSLLKPDGMLLLETAITDSQQSDMLFNGPPKRVYNDVTTWWVPSLPCVREMLAMTAFEHLEYSVHVMHQWAGFSRMACWARAQRVEEISPELLAELRRTYRNPGLGL